MFVAFYKALLPQCLQDKNDIITLTYAALSLVIIICVNIPKEKIYQFHGNMFFIMMERFAFSERGVEGKGK